MLKDWLITEFFDERNGWCSPQALTCETIQWWYYAPPFPGNWGSVHLRSNIAHNNHLAACGAFGGSRRVTTWKPRAYVDCPDCLALISAILIRRSDVGQ